MFLDPVARLRRFNRAVTREAGALDLSFLGRGRPLGTVRVLVMVRPEGTDVALIRDRLGLDSGLMSRFLRSLEREGLIETATDPADRRRRIARLTPAGEAELAAYDAIGHARAARLIARAGSRADEMVAAMDLIATLLNRAQLDLRPADPDSPEILACWRGYVAELVARVPGARPELFPVPDPGADSYRPPHGRSFVAWSDDLPVGCVSLRPLASGGAEVKRLWVHDSARGQGLARRLMTQIEEEARTMGHTTLKLDTNSALSEAIALYRATGWTDISPYTGPPADVWMGKTL
ncbi:helix-turn-helix domain-containing GNAT family N-acetyltransferase [Tabrizicola sp.]|uniref:bifunctional helix-turn-helix transcriptional regulator/GNAT family N-acetyltransferase n=1 Tax=Tabrizicola sp. TaxID=2005166 RepID=UPI002736BC36|nr:helix-turn-helix domain-containing GNAT family N-acetyltransferase [Tabrizicola sp.]MDP3196069.1 helix-turn-helix domain-containing GNAT family N-acetyltransferase [Tabrizicola sp.]